MPDRGDLIIYQGDDWGATVTVTSNGVPPDQVIAGYTAKAQIRQDVADNDPDVDIEIVTAVASPAISLTIPASQTVNLCGDYVWDLQITSPAGQVTTILAGNVRVTSEVTRAVA
ncbi:MAG TPA: hypothetical protein VFV58_39475 [Blastocatellia bacterium]|jgi:hypothetical protein|nr:hypothetical protein [Blastocatellia bacterium]